MCIKHLYKNEFVLALYLYLCACDCIVCALCLNPEQTSCIVKVDCFCLNSTCGNEYIGYGNCEICGGSYTYFNKIPHEKSKKHQQHLKILKNIIDKEDEEDARNYEIVTPPSSATYGKQFIEPSTSESI